MPTIPNIQVRNSLMYLLALQPPLHPISWLTFSNTSTSEDEIARRDGAGAALSLGDTGRTSSSRKQQFLAFTPTLPNPKAIAQLARLCLLWRLSFLSPETLACNIQGRVLLLLPTDIYLTCACHLTGVCAVQTHSCPFLSPASTALLHPCLQEVRISTQAGEKSSHSAFTSAPPPAIDSGMPSNSYPGGRNLPPFRPDCIIMRRRTVSKG